MTYQTKYKENKRLIQLFAEYLDECKTIDEKIKISAEIGRLTAENNRIGQMPLEETKEQYHYGILQVTAIL